MSEKEKLTFSPQELIDLLPQAGGFQVTEELSAQLNDIVKQIHEEQADVFDQANLITKRIVVPLALAMSKVKFDGIRKGYWTFAWWKDSVEYVGSTGKTLKAALTELDEEQRKFETMVQRNTV